jgi:tetratricopeptide (TPR) repeat protein
MKKFLLSLTALTLFATFALAQNVEDGIKFLYYERNTSAMQTLQKAVAANPKDARTIYWLGQAYLANDDIAGAKAVYQKALNDGINDPWIWIGMGNVQLLDGKGDVNAAKQNFEQAITSAKGKKGSENADILNAIGRANAQGSSLQGDANYGIDVLKRAQAIDLKNPDIDINLGVCYLKLGGEMGGQAVTAFQDALTRNPQYAAADFKIGKVYESQDNKEFMAQWFDKAIAADPAYAPVYLGYFDYYEERDVNQAKSYLDKWLANSDQDCESSFFVADYAFRAGNTQESLTKAKAMEAGDCKNYPRLDLLFAYNYDKTGDSMQAKTYLSKFFATVSADKIHPEDYLFAGKLYGKIPGYQDTASAYLQKAIDADTIIRDKIVYANTAVNIMGNSGNLQAEMYWMNKLGNLRGGTMAEADYYKLATAAEKALLKADTAYMTQHDTVTIMKSYTLADSIDNAYITAFSAKPQGYSFRVRAAKISDYDTTKGLAIDPMTQQNNFLSKDTSAYAKKVSYLNDYYLLIYYAQYAKNIAKIDAYKKAIDIASQMIVLYPDPASDENQFAVKTQTQLQAAVTKYQQKQNSPPKSNK